MYVLIIRQHFSSLIVHDSGLSRMKAVDTVDKSLEPLSIELSKYRHLPAKDFKRLLSARLKKFQITL